jgi:hypothetical protein
MAAAAKARLLLCLCCALLALAAAQPAWPSPAADWKYLNADGSINGHYKFTYLIDGALSRCAANSCASTSTPPPSHTAQLSGPHQHQRLRH